MFVSIIVGDPKKMKRTFLIKLNCSSALMQQRTVVCSAVINQKSSDFSNDFFRQMEITNKGCILY